MSEDGIQMLIKEGIAAAKAGHKSLAYPLLQEVTRRDPDNEVGWLWLAGVSESPTEAENYLRRVLEINPFNEHALAGLRWTRTRNTDSTPSETTPGCNEAEVFNCPFCETTSKDKFDKCPDCRAVITLDDLEALFNNDEVNKPKILMAIAVYESALLDKQDFDTHFNLGLAYLNLKEIEAGISHLRAAGGLRIDDQKINSLIEQIVNRDPASPNITPKVEKHGTVLIVDDSPTVCKLVTLTLERQGYTVIPASDGLEALAKINERLPDLILLDIMMPRMDGYQLCKTIKGNQETENIPVVMLSGKDGFLDKVRGRMVGSADHIDKPFEPEVLLQMVKKYLNPNNHARS